MSGGVDDIDVDIDDHRDHRNNNNMNDSTTTIEIKHGKASIHIEISKRSTIRELKRKIERETGIEPMNQKMPNLKLGKHLAPDEASIESLGKLPNKVMLLGKSTKDVTELKNLEKEMLEKAPEILDDFESDVLDSEPLLCYADPVYVARLAARVEKYKGLSPLNETREGKKLLVLDIDYTLFDHRTPGENAQELARPYLHDFLSSAYKRYDIVIWSATSMLWVKTKMQELGVLSHPSYKILALVDSGSMITVQTKERGIFNCKPLGWIWAQPWSQERGYDSSNTIMFDDLRRNFAMNPSSGLKIKPFRNAHTSRATDNELKKLKVYVDIIARENVDFKTLDHKKWERYVLKALKEGKLSEHEAKEVKSFWPNSTVVRELLANQQPGAVAAQTGNQQQQQQQQQQEKKDEKAKAQKKQDAFFEHIFDDKRCGQTVNIISSRIFFDLVRSIDFKNVLSNLLEKKLNELPGLPKYVGKFDVEKLSLGEATPKCNMLRPVDGSDGSNAPWDGGSLPGRGVCAAVEADLSYVGLIEVTIRTRVDLAQYAKEIGNLVEGGDAAGVEENDEDAAGKTNDSVTSKSGSRTPTPPLSPTNSGRIPPLNKTKEEVTQNVLKEMKKVVENVNDRVLQKFPLKMTLRVSSCSGTFRFWIPPPPNERLWWGLKGRPRVDIFCEPAIGENKIAHEFIAKKVSHLLSSKLVSDICDELVLPNCASDPMKELIRFEHFVPEIAFEDAIQLSEGNGAFLVTNAASSEDVSSTTYLRGEKKGDEHIVLSKSGSENAFSAQLLPNAPKEEEKVEDHQQQQVQEKQEKQQRKSVSLKRENSTKRQEEKNALDATAEWLLSDSHFDSPPTSAAKAPPSSSSQPLSPKSPTGGNNNMIGFGNKREDVLRAKGGGGASSFSSARPTSPDHQNHQNNLFASLSRSIKQKAEENLSKMKSDFQEVQKGLQNGGVEGAVQNIKQIAMKRAKETTTATTTTASTHSSSSSSSQQQRQRQ